MPRQKRFLRNSYDYFLLVKFPPVKHELNSEIHISGNNAEGLSSFLKDKNYSAHFILTDDNTHKHCLPVFTDNFRGRAFDPETGGIIKIYAGEQHKNIQAVEYVWKRLSEANADRNSVLINLGGGMVCDLGGFAAATYKRGIDFIHVPTSLLAMCDAAIGGKQGIDFLNFKNQVGVFESPRRVFINDGFLKTLPQEQLVSGFAEVVKHAFIAGGKFRKSVMEIDDLAKVRWKKIISASIDLKLSVVNRDPFEKNFRKVLNFGHTIGHALESFLLDKKLSPLHGNCVAAGMIGELYLSCICCGLSDKKREEAVSFIKSFFPKINFDEADISTIISLMKQDKKNSGGKIKMVLLEKFGKPMIDQEVDEMLIEEALRFVLRESGQ